MSTFYRENDAYFVRTHGPDGAPRDYRIAYTFGVHPLQQYLIEFPDGKLQAFSIAWDSREKSEGGQRWFHLHPDEPIAYGDELHWSGINYNWNFMCADCHSTGLQKNFNLATQKYNTEWAEIHVGCEACHGPGSRHLNWAQNPDLSLGNKGLSVSYSKRRQAVWTMDTESGIATLKEPVETQREIETCAQCHARRAASFPGAQAGDPFLDHFNPALLQEDLYHADGQINGEVFVYGSFLQSRMYAAGVTCSNCHNPHSLRLNAEGNGVCTQCHLPAKFDTSEHHFHPAGSTGAQCVNCHMPAKTYMQVDARRDHSFRKPRPDLSDKLGTPNACSGCHRDMPVAWAAEVLKEHFGSPKERHFGEAIYAGRHGLPGAEDQLVALILDTSQPAIARATATSLLTRYLSPASLQLLQTIAQSDEPLLNLGIAQSLESVSPQLRPSLAIPLLYSDHRVIAAMAANSLSGLVTRDYPPAVQNQFNRAMKDYLESETFNADRPESLSNLAALHAQRGNRKQAEAFYRRALTVAPFYTPAYVNLADVYRTEGREREAEILLRQALNKVRARSPVEHALGLSLVRQKRLSDALPHLRRAAEGQPGSPRYIYVYAIALNDSGNPQQAIAVLEQGLKRFPGNREILGGLVALLRSQGNLSLAEQYQEQLN
ncbi:tetratricopeptide repeat protein [Microbulbifer thermotolerans]|uniref:tetratricopeptide repeat protein n=1 Tax=Microbulbifer thermotolerans TaxID=252514 RepID=UPI0026714C92|nr:tetratricopeptide repeat protein [Microbulbifer thermotolerans]WKT62023.1 tetratricopeptide repeat protein [Microbulbifer thermotolerans]